MPGTRLDSRTPWRALSMATTMVVAVLVLISFGGPPSASAAGHEPGASKVTGKASKSKAKSKSKASRSKAASRRCKRRRGRARRACLARLRCMKRRSGASRRGCLAKLSFSTCYRRAAYPAPLHSEGPGVSYNVSRAFVDPGGCKVTLNGFNIFPVWSSGSLAWTQGHYNSIRARGFTAVRFFMPWRYYEPAPGQFTNLDDLDRAVAQARAAGLYVILVPIGIGGGNLTPAWTQGADEIDRVANSARPYLQEIARRYKNEPAVAGYDLVNEPPSADQNRILRMYSTLIDWVRAVDADKIVLTNAGYGNTSMASSFVNPAYLRHRHNVVHTAHHYYAGNGRSTVSAGYSQYGMNSGYQTWNGGGYPNPGDEDDLEAQLNVQMSYARRAGVAYWVGEFGVHPSAPNASALAADWARLFDRYGLGRAWWLYNLKNSEFAPKTLSGAWKPIISQID